MTKANPRLLHSTYSDVFGVGSAKYKYDHANNLCSLKQVIYYYDIKIVEQVMNKDNTWRKVYIFYKYSSSKVGV